jgi:hypothetical protein
MTAGNGRWALDNAIAPGKEPALRHRGLAKLIQLVKVVSDHLVIPLTGQTFIEP